VLFAAVDSAWAGAQAQMLELAAGLDPAEFEPVLLTTGTGELIERARTAGVATHLLPFGMVRRQSPFVDYYALGPLRLNGLLTRERIALVHTHDPNSTVSLARAAGRRHIPMVSHVHDLDQRWVTARSLAALRATRSVIATTSDAVSRYTIARGADPEQVRRIYNGVHLACFAADARERVRAELGLLDDEVAVALVGRLVERKGQADLIRALADPRVAARPVRLFLIGGGAERDAEYESGLRDLTTDLGLASRITFLGERHDAPQLLRGMDLSVVPSRREAFGRVVVEGMHAGTPVVAYDDGALPELVRDEVDGIVVPTGEIAGLAAAIARLASDSALRARMSASAHARAREFSHERFVENATALYRAMLDGTRS
jgi:glycosyltransferase involved in cell wall biosynthesis